MKVEPVERDRPCASRDSGRRVGWLHMLPEVDFLVREHRKCTTGYRSVVSEIFASWSYLRYIEQYNGSGIVNSLKRTHIPSSGVELRLE